MTYCTCTVPFAHPTDIDPPEIRRDKQCPIHGTLANVDPDRARDEKTDWEMGDHRDVDHCPPHDEREDGP